MAAIKSEPKAHSILGASSAKRWTHCPGSVRLSVGMPNKSSVYAAEGTAAHELAEKCLRSREPAADYLGSVIETEDGAFEVTQEMVDGVQLYVDTVLSDLKATPAAVFQVESQFSLNWLYDGLFGTNDALVGEHFGLLRVYDLKYGRGVPVEVEDNEQLKYYALGAAYGHDYDVVELVVVQPRAFHTQGPVRRWRTTIEELTAWGRDVLLPAAQATARADAPLCAGDWCRWCDAKPICPEIRKAALQAIQAEFDDDALPVPGKTVSLPDPLALNAEAIGRTLALLEILEPWMKSVKDTAKDMLSQGKPVPGWKLVAGKKGNRRWAKPEAEIAAGLFEVGDEIYEPRKLRSPAQVEKLFPSKKAAKEALEGLIEQPEGAPAMVPEHDARPAIQPQALILEQFND